MSTTSRVPVLEFQAVRVDRATQPAQFSALGTAGRIELRGALSAGGVGWTLSATVSRQRNTVDLFVTARQAESADVAGLEDYDYEAVIELPPGLYHLRLKHIYVLPDARGALSWVRLVQSGLRVR